MIVHRFMSLEEYQKLLTGATLTNHTDHNKERCGRTTSVGFCFFVEAPDQAVNWLAGIADLDRCVTLQVPDDYLTPSAGMYVDEEERQRTGNYTLTNVPMQMRAEYCRTDYSLSHPGVHLMAATGHYADKYPQRQMIDQAIKEFLDRMNSDLD